MKHYVDLKPYFNFNLVYPASHEIDEDNPVGLDNYFIYDGDYSYGPLRDDGGRAFLFEKNGRGEQMLTCEKQRIKIGKYCGKIHLAGFTVWGHFKERLEAGFSDGTTEYAKAYFSELCYPLSAFPGFELERKLYDDCCQILHKTTIHSQDAYFYCYTTVFNGRKRLDCITLPDNPHMFIQAITLE